MYVYVIELTTTWTAYGRPTPVSGHVYVEQGA